MLANVFRFIQPLRLGRLHFERLAADAEPTIPFLTTFFIVSHYPVRQLLVQIASCPAICWFGE